jgi:hypothetical protein
MRRPPGVALGAMLASLAATAAAPASADPPSRVLVVRERKADAVVARAQTRLVAELRAAGFAVDDRVVDDAADARRLVEEPEDGGAFATVLLQRASAGATTDVWVADHVTHKTVMRRMKATGRGDAADRSLALRVVELMRASLVEALVLPPSEPATDPAGDAADGAPAPATPPPASQSPAPPPDVERWTREAVREPVAARAPGTWLAVGAAATFAGPAVGFAIAPALTVAWRPAEAWSLGVWGVGPAYGARATGGEGTADVRQELALAEGAGEISLGGPARAFVAVGAGAYHFAASGNALSPYTSGQADSWSALLGAGLGLRVRVAGPASVVLEARELLALPRPVMAFAGERVGTLMSPGTVAGLSLAVDL